MAAASTYWRDLAKDWGLSFGVLVVVFVLWGQCTSPSYPPGPAPELDLVSLEGEPLSLSAMQDEVVFLNFWFTSCGPCRHEIPAFSAFQEKHPEARVIGVSIDQGMSSAQLAAASKRLGVRYAVAHDVRQRVASAYRVSLYPTTFLIVGGEIERARRGPMTARDLENWLSWAKRRAIADPAE